MTAPIVFLDTETDGVHPGRKAWEVAWIRREPDGRESSDQFFLPIDLSTADPFGLQVGRFYERHPWGRRIANPAGTKVPAVKPLAAAAQSIARATHEAHIVGAVPSFDTEILDRLLREQGLIPSWHYHLCDVENLAVGFLAARAMPIQPPWSSDDLTRALGIQPAAPAERHTALGDARWAQRIYDAVLHAEAAATKETAA